MSVTGNFGVILSIRNFYLWKGQKGTTGYLRELLLKRFLYGKHIIVSNIEHPAVKGNQPSGCRIRGFEVDFAPVDKASLLR